MAVCSWCFTDMMIAQSCAVDVLHRHGVPISMIPCGREFGWPRTVTTCGDCGVSRGGWHHPGCDMQQCPSCGGQMLSCDCRFDEDDDDEDDDFEDDDDEFDVAAGTSPFGVDSNGLLTERMWINGTEVILHYDDVPESDFTVVDGIRCTTALRTLIDLAMDMEPDALEHNLRDCLERGLFTVAEAHQRVSQPDMAERPGAQRLRGVLASVD